MKHVSTCATLEGVNEAASLVTETQVKMKDAFTSVTIATDNKSTSTSVFHVDSGTQVETKNSPLNVSIESKNESEATSVVDVNLEIDFEDHDDCKTSSFDQIVREQPYDEKAEIVMFDENLKDPKLSSYMVSS